MIGCGGGGWGGGNWGGRPWRGPCAPGPRRAPRHDPHAAAAGETTPSQDCGLRPRGPGRADRAARGACVRFGARAEAAGRGCRLAAAAPASFEDTQSPGADCAALRLRRAPGDAPIGAPARRARAAHPRAPSSPAPQGVITQPVRQALSKVGFYLLLPAITFVKARRGGGEK